MQFKTLSSGIFKAVFDKLPHVTLILNKSGDIVYTNKKAQDTFRLNSGKNSKRRLGDLFNCIHNLYGKKECGLNKDCVNCIIHKTVNDALAQNQIEKTKGTITIEEKEELKVLNMLISVSTVVTGEEPYVILTLEDISQITSAFQGFITVCSHCKNVHDENMWSSIENYIEENTEATTTHTTCPECIRLLYPEYADKMPKII